MPSGIAQALAARPAELRGLAGKFGTEPSLVRLPVGIHASSSRRVERAMPSGIARKRSPLDQPRYVAMRRYYRQEDGWGRRLCEAS